MLQKLPANNFEQIKYTSEFNIGFMKNYNEKSYEVYFIEVYFKYPEKLHEVHNDLPFYHFSFEKSSYCE